MRTRTFSLWGAAALVLAALAGCGSGDDEEATPAPPPPTATVQEKLAAAAALPENDTSTNSSASFTAVQDAGVPAVTINSPPKVNFTVFSDGKVKSDLAITSVRFAIAKLVPGTDGNPDQWVNYIYTKETAAATVGPGGKPVLPTAMQATTDGKQTDPALLAAQFVYNSDGYYTYTFKTDIKDIAQTNGVVFEPGRTHRVAIQLNYKNAAGETVLVNPYFDFTVDANGNSVTVTDPTKTRKMTDVSSCNSCHEKLALHGGGRVDTQYCVMCHNPGTVDANSGNNLNLSTMAHKIHSGKLLYSQLAKGGEEYTIWGYQNSKHDYAEVGFPQDLRNCTKCHSASNPKTPQGDNWKTAVSKEACLTCHANGSGSVWEVGTDGKSGHKVYAATLVKAGAAAKDLTNQQCKDCHTPSSNIGSERVHWNQNEENAAKYKMNIESVAYDAGTRKVTVKYFLSDPTNGNAAYNLVTSDCTGSGASLACANTTKFGNLRFYLAYQNMVGQSTATTEFSAYNNGGSSANAYAYKGTNDGANHYTVDIPLAADEAGLKVAFGTARVVSIGQIKEAKLQVKAATDPRPEVTPKTLINTVVQHTYKDVVLSGELQARRNVVSNDKCNACHGALGTTSGANTMDNGFHSGARNTVEACVVCHDPNRVSSSVMASGQTQNSIGLNESYQFKRMIHGIHGNSKRTYPYNHGNPVQGQFDMKGTLLADGFFLNDYKATVKGVQNVVIIKAGTVVAKGETFVTIGEMMTKALQAKKDAAGDTTATTPVFIENYAAEVAWPGVGINCNACHVDNSYKTDMGTLGAVVSKQPSTEADPNKWLVISPKAASCTGCHDSSTAIGHVTSFGAASFADKAQGSRPQETCDDCHSSGGYKGVDIVHGQK